MTVCRTASVETLETVLGWAADEGWNPGLEDAAAFHRADPAGFFVALDPSDAPIAAISVVNHTPDFAFLGLYIVRPAYRGRGIGLALWQHALRHAGDRTVGLDGVAAQQQNYAASGFVHAGGTTRFTGAVTGARHPGVDAARPEDIDTLVAREAAASGVAKQALLRRWLARTDTRATFVARAAGQVQGFCTARRCQSGTKIGPLVAADADTARALVQHVAATFPQPVTLDVPDRAQRLARVCAAFGMVPGFRTARMYRGPFSPVQDDFFAVCSLELG